MNTFSIRAIIIDDEQEARDVMQNLLKKVPEVQIVSICDGAESGLEAILQNRPDLIFIDVKMPRKSGMEVVKELSEKQVKTTVVFVTAYDEYAIQALRVAAFDFLLKPVDPDELRQVIKRFQAEKGQDEFDRKIDFLVSQFKKPEKIRLNSRSGFVLVDPTEIVYIEADGNYSEIIFSKNRKEVVSMQLGAIGEFLPPGKFYRTSRSTLINLCHLRRVDRRNRICELEKEGELFSVHVSRNIIGDFDRALK